MPVILLLFYIAIWHKEKLSNLLNFLTKKYSEIRYTNCPLSSVLSLE